MRTAILTALVTSLTACATQPAAPADPNGDDGGDGVDVCPIELGSPRFDYAPFSTVVFANEPVTITAGWTDDCSATACIYAGAGACEAPAIDVAVSTTGVPAEVTLTGHSSTDGELEPGRYQTFEVVPSGPGPLTIHVEDTHGGDSPVPSVTDQAFEVRQLDDIELACFTGNDLHDCGDALASGDPFELSFAGVSQGQLFDIPAHLTFDGAAPTSCTNTGTCIFSAGTVTTSFTVTADYASVSRVFSITVQ
jgi:hypothetical protein